MADNGSGRYGGRPTVESAFRIHLDMLIRERYIRPGARSGCRMHFSGYFHELDVDCETTIVDPWNSWMHLRYSMTDYWTDEDIEIDDKIFLATSQPPFGGLRWWFVCPHLNERVRKLYLPLGARHFWSRQALQASLCIATRDGLRPRVAAGSKTLSPHSVAIWPMTNTRTSRRECDGRRTIGVMDKLRAADGVADERIMMLAASFLGR